MSLLARAKIPTPLCRIPGDLASKVKILNTGEQIRFIGSKKVGLNTFYYTSDNLFILSKEVQILRDEDYFFNNYKSKNLMRKNYSMAGGKGLTAILSNETENTGMYRDSVNLFAAGDNFVDPDTMPVTSANNPRPNNTSYVLGSAIDFGSGSGLIPSVSDGNNASRTINNVIKGSSGLPIGDQMDMPVGTQANSTGGTIVSSGRNNGGITATDLIVNIASTYLKSWVSEKLSYVVGFGTSSGLTQILRMFGIDFRSLLTSGLSNIFGNIGGIFGNIFANAFNLRGRSGNPYDPYDTVSEALLKYFKYKGCDGRMIVKSYAGLRWEQDESYATPTLTPQKDTQEVQIFKDIYNDDYTTITKDSMDKIKEEFDLDIDRSDTFNKFNRFRVVTPNNALVGTKGYVFFTRPDLNLELPDPNSLNENGGSTNSTTSTMESTNAMNDLMDASSGNGTALDVTRARISTMASNLMKSHSTLASYLMGDKAGVDHEFVPILGHLCTGLDIADEVLETTEYGDTYTGWKYVYGTSMIKSKTAGTMNVNFSDDNKLSIYKMIKIWCEYINAVYRGETRPKKIYLDRHILDYAISIYYFLTDNTGTNILFWTKYTGAFPTSVPSSNFADSTSSTIKNPSYSVTFAFSRKDDCNPIHLAEFNHLSDISGGKPEGMPMYNPDTLRSTRSFAGAPFVDTTDGGYTYHLRFRK